MSTAFKFKELRVARVCVSELLFPSFSISAIAKFRSSRAGGRGFTNGFTEGFTEGFTKVSLSYRDLTEFNRLTE